MGAEDEPTSPVRRAEGLERSLGGDLPCVACRYNLRGLSIIGTCPECGTPVRATLLAAIDPYAGVLRPIPASAVVAAGGLMWAFGGLAAAVLTWLIRLEDVLRHLAGIGFSVRWAVIAGTGAIVASGVGALVIVRPHSGIPRRQIIAAAIGSACYVPLAVVYWRIESAGGLSSVAPYLQTDFASAERALERLAAAALLLVILLGLRPNARLLAGRSLLLREGRVDRQTMLAMTLVVVIGAIGDGLHLYAGGATDATASMIRLVGTLLIIVTSMLFTVGLFGVANDVRRIAAVILVPAPSAREVLGAGRGRSSGANGAREST